MSAAARKSAATVPQHIAKAEAEATAAATITQLLTSLLSIAEYMRQHQPFLSSVHIMERLDGVSVRFSDSHLQPVRFCT